MLSSVTLTNVSDGNRRIDDYAKNGGPGEV